MGVLDFDLTSDGTKLIAAAMDGIYEVVAIADREGGDSEADSAQETRQPQKIGQHESWVSGVALLDDEKRLVTAGYDGAIQFHRRDGEQPTKTVQAHSFWSWKLAACKQNNLVASVSGQYIAGNEKYAPKAVAEPTVKVFDAMTGELRHAFEMLPSVQAAALSPDGRLVAAANLMGDVSVWKTEDGQLQASWRTDDFTSWGIIKSHCYIGGIHALMFAADGQSLYAAGMGPMRDPMAGNGRQLWQQWRWDGEAPRKIAETNKDQAGEGLMEALAMHPSGQQFVMAGRLRGGEWNVGLFSCEDGNLIAQAKTGTRITSARFSPDGKHLWLGGMKGQPGPDKKGRWPAFGTIDCYELT